MSIGADSLANPQYKVPFLRAKGQLSEDCGFQAKRKGTGCVFSGGGPAAVCGGCVPQVLFSDKSLDLT